MHSKFTVPKTTRALIAEFRADFPEFNESVYFLMGVNHGDEACTPLSIAEKMMELPLSPKDAMLDYGELLAKRVAEIEKMPRCPAVHGDEFNIVTGFDEKGFGPVGYEVMGRMQAVGGRLGEHLSAKAQMVFGERMDQYDLTSMFDHEIGHIVTKKHANPENDKAAYERTNAGNTYDEMRADCYSMLRHIQRFGKDTGYPEFVRDTRARTLLQGDDVTHYTSPALQELIDMKNKGLLDDPMTPQQAADLAVRIANRHVITFVQGAELANATENGVATGDYAKTPLQTLSELQKMIKQANLPLLHQAGDIVFKAARKVLPMFDAQMKYTIAKAHAAAMAQPPKQAHVHKGLSM